jgi:hypothetical protein
MPEADSDGILGSYGMFSLTLVGRKGSSDLPLRSGLDLRQVVRFCGDKVRWREWEELPEHEKLRYEYDWQQTALAIALGAAIAGKPRRGRHRRGADPELVGNILQWMRGRQRQGAHADELTEEAYVLHRWPDRYGPQDELLEGKFALVRAMLAPKRILKRSVLSGIRWFREYQLRPTGHTWADLKRRALTED